MNTGQDQNARYALVCDSGREGLGLVALRLLRLGIDALYAGDLDEALLLAAQEGSRIRAILFPAQHDEREPTSIMKQIASSPEGCSPTLVAIGECPSPADRTRLRAAGVRWAVWEPANDSVLRFVVNSALLLPTEMAGRKELRVPTNLLGRFRSKAGRQDALVYSLSARGAFLETPRPLPKGSEVDLEIWFPRTVLRTGAQVVYSNAPDGRREPRLPLGMSVVFAELDPGREAHLRRYVEERASCYVV
jgi:hypothetical protein